MFLIAQGRRGLASWDGVEQLNNASEANNVSCMYDNTGVGLRERHLDGRHLSANRAQIPQQSTTETRRETWSN